MITTGDARNILVRDCSDFGIKGIFTSWAAPEGRIKSERIVVVTPSEQSSGTYWENCYVSVNLCVPDVKGDANLQRLDDLERPQRPNSKSGPMGHGTDRHIATDMRTSAAKRIKTSGAITSMFGSCSEC